MAFILTKPNRGSGLPGIVIENILINSNATEIIDSISLSTSHQTLKWIISISDTVSKTVSFEILANNSFGNLTDNSYGFIGNIIDFDYFVVNEVGNIRLKIINNELNNIIVNAVRIQTFP